MPKDSGHKYSPVRIHMFKLHEKGFEEGVYESNMFSTIGDYGHDFEYKGGARDTFTY